MNQSSKFFKIKYVLISLTYLFAVSLFAGTKFLSDIKVTGKGNEFAEYQIKSTIYSASIILNHLLLNDNPHVKIVILLDDKIKESKFSIGEERQQLLIVTNTSVIQDDFLQQFIINFLAAEYGYSPNLLKGGWFAEGCYSYVKRNLITRKGKRQGSMIIVDYLASFPIKLDSKKIAMFNDSNSNFLVKALYRELSDLFITSVMSLPNGKTMLFNYVHGKKIDLQEIDIIMKNKLNSYIPKKEQINNETAIKHYLKEVEAEKIPVGKRYNLYFSIIKQNQLILNTLWPELGNYLDNEYPVEIYAK